MLGSGAFGTVHRGMWLHSGSSSRQQLVEKEVAVKSMDGMASEDDRVKFLQEAAIMGQFNHPNIITILGIVPDIPVCFKAFVVVQEYMSPHCLLGDVISIAMFYFEALAKDF